MRLDRLAALVATVAPDRTSPVADLAAARWDLPPGTGRYVRTSASSVFAAGDGYLRLQPLAEHRAEDVAAVAAVAAALARAGAPVVPPRASASGRLAEVVATADPVVPGVHATLVAAAPGVAKELDELTTREVEQWGGALARLHEAGRSVPRAGLPTWPEVVRRSLGPPGDPRLADVVETLIERCVALLGPPGVLVHGDAQPDNAGWTATGPVLFDLDDACVSWAAADLAMAVRDALPIDALDTPVTGSAPGRALLRGYRRQAHLDVAEERAVPLLQRLSAALTYGRLRTATAPGGVAAPEPDWVLALRARLLDLADRLGTALLRPGAI